MSGKLQIGALRYKGMLFAATPGGNVLGQADYARQTVRILDDLPLDGKRQTIWHEAWHPLFEQGSPGRIYLNPELTADQREGFLDLLADHAFTLCARSRWEENGKLLVPSYGR